MLLLRPLVSLLALSSCGRRRNRRKRGLYRSHGKSSSSYYDSVSHPRLKPLLRDDPNCHVLVDAENVRGKSAFRLTHSALLRGAALWTDWHGLYDRVSIVIDHGSVASGHYLPDCGMAVLFAGRKDKADDVIARDVSFFGDEGGGGGGAVVVATSDRELIGRCRKASRRSGKGGRLGILDPARFLDEVESLLAREAAEARGSADRGGATETRSDRDGSAEGRPPLRDDEGADSGGGGAVGGATEEGGALDGLAYALNREIRLGASLLEAESLLRSSPNASAKRKRKLQRKICDLRSKLNAGKARSTLSKITSVLERGDDGGGEEGSTTAREEREALLDRWETVRRSSGRREETGDRVVLAERLRRKLERGAPPIVARHGAEGDEARPEEFAAGDDDDDVVVSAATATGPAEAHVRRHNSFLFLRSPSSAAASTIAPPKPLPKPQTPGLHTGLPLLPPPASPRTLRIVVVSDTHGFERHLTGHPTSGTVLPPGDLLLHLGDFATDGPPDSRRVKRGLVEFDAWLASQSHPAKIVLRGNHDPLRLTFPESNATYVTAQRTIDVDGVRITLVPYCSTKDVKPLPASCDVLASHVPPRSILDRCLSGGNGGSPKLRSLVERNRRRRSRDGGGGGRPPRVWLCGHIHEGRGSVRTKFGGSGGNETLVVNAANANPGRARRLDHPARVVDVPHSNSVEPPTLHDFVVDGRRLLLAAGAPTSTMESTKKRDDDLLDDDDTGEMLLAIDLGLNSGLALYADSGELVRYGQFAFDDEGGVRDAAPALLAKWESDANDVVDDDNGGLGDRDSPDDGDGKEDDDDDDATMATTTTTKRKRRWAVTRVAIEGGDPALRDAWSSAARAAGAEVRDVHPSEWRSDLLTDKERSSGRSSKEASRLIARQIVCDLGSEALEKPHAGKFGTDAAESVAMGMHVARRLGWVTREPAVRRYTNGGVVLPKK